MSATLVMQEEEFRQMNLACEKLVREANVRVVFVIDKNGQLMASGGEADRLDSTSLASLVAGEYAATNGIAKLIGEKDFTVLFHEGVNDSLHISLVSSRAILVVIFDKRSSLGLVRLRVKKVAEEIGRILDILVTRSNTPGAGKTPMTEITDEDIDNLFAD